MASSICQWNSIAVLQVKIGKTKKKCLKSDHHSYTIHRRISSKAKITQKCIQSQNTFVIEFKLYIWKILIYGVDVKYLQIVKLSSLALSRKIEYNGC